MKPFWYKIMSSMGLGRLDRNGTAIRHGKHQDEPGLEYGDQAEPLMERKNDGFPMFRRESSTWGVYFKHCARPFVLTCPTLVTLILLCLALGAAVVVIIGNRDIGVNTHAERMIEPCGKTPDEARARGCKFDVISFCWLAPRCYDAELSRQFDDANALEWYLDPNRTIPLSHEQIMTGEWTNLYVNWEYHLRHCTAMWKKLHRAVIGGKGRQSIDGYIGSLEHTHHCEQMLLSDRSIDFGVFNTRIAVKFPDCGI